MIKKLFRKFFPRTQVYNSIEEWLIHNPIGPEMWKPGSYYSPDGQCVFFYLEAGEYIAKWINHDITLYYNPDDGRLIGGMIHVPTK